MTLFWIMAAAMVALAAGLVLWPLWRQRGGDGPSRDAVDVVLYKERLAELQQDRAEGRLDEDRYRRMEAELARTLLNDVPEASGQSRRPSLAPAGAALALLIPLGGLGYYWLQPQTSVSREWLDIRADMQPLVEQALAAPEQFWRQPPENLFAFAQTLKAHLLARGADNPGALYLLGLAYLQLQQPQAAQEALERAWSLDPGRPQLAYALAQSLVLGNEGKVDQRSGRLLARVLQAQPDHQGALLLLGFGALNAGDYDGAIAAWERLLSLRDPDSEGARLLQRSITQARQMRAAQSSGETADGGGPQLTVTVDIDPDLKGRIPPGATLFVFAKAAAGPPMPLAAVRQPAQGFPARVVLDDSRAMMPELKLSTADKVVVGARISASGAVGEGPGDLRGETAPIDLDGGAQTVAVVVNQQLGAETP